VNSRLTEFLKSKRDRLRKILLLSDLHATRITLATAELLTLNDVIRHPKLHTVGNMLATLPVSVWVGLLGFTGLAQIYFIIRGQYHDHDAILFAGWNAMLWILMTTISIVRDGMFPGPTLALTFSASWIFVRSGFPIHGNRSSDYEGRREKERT